MALAQTMQQVATHTWTFDGRSARVAPMKGFCRQCQGSVAILRPEGISLPTGNYVVQGDCGVCGQEVLLIVS